MRKDPATASVTNIIIPAKVFCGFRVTFCHHFAHRLLSATDTRTTTQKSNNNDVRRNLIFCHPFRPPCARWQARARQVRQVRSPGFCFRHTSFLFLTFYFFIIFGEERNEKNNVRQCVLHTESADVMPDSTDIGQTSRAVPSATTRKTFQRTFQRTSRRRHIAALVHEPDRQARFFTTHRSEGRNEEISQDIFATNRRKNATLYEI